MNALNIFCLCICLLVTCASLGLTIRLVAQRERVGRAALSPDVLHWWIESIIAVVLSALALLISIAVPPPTGILWAVALLLVMSARFAVSLIWLPPVIDDPQRVRQRKHVLSYEVAFLTLALILGLLGLLVSSPR